MADTPVFTYQTRLPVEGATASLLDAYAALHGRVERYLFVAMQRGEKINDLKREFLRRFGITARQFNAIRVGLEGKIDAIKRRQPELIAEGEQRIKKAERIISKLTKSAPGTNKLHQKKRRLATMKARVSSMQADVKAGTVRLCFGSRRLFRAQFDLAANGYASHAEWLTDWRETRSNQFFVLGSQDETAGNQTCQATVAEDGSLTLTLRLPDALATQGKFLTLAGVRFAYGHASIIAALSTSRRLAATTKAGTPTVKRVGTAISYRFLRDEKGWRVFASVQAQEVAQVSRRDVGAIGVDVNADHLAVSETDRFGNLIGSRRMNLPLYGKSQQQARALIGDAAMAIATLANKAGKPVVVEKLDFQKKKAELEAVDPRQARMVSSFAYRQVSAHLKAACFRAGVEVIEVNPAYTSVIGAVNHAQLHGISVHQGAALAIARRGLGLSERPTVRQAVVPARNGGHVTFSLPERNRGRHVWSLWSGVRTRLRAAHVAHFRCGDHLRPPPPLSPARPTERPIWSSTAKLRGANRHQHCSGGVMELGDVPY